VTEWNTLALKHLPSQLLKRKRWGELEDWLTSLEFIEAKCSAGMVRELISDFENAERVAPQSNPEVKEWERAHFFANWEEPPCSDLGIRTERWAQCRQFVSLEAHNFERHTAQHPGLFLQQAFNQPRDSYVSTASHRLILSRSGHQAWFERINRATSFHASACRRIHHRTADHLIILPDGKALSAAADHSLELWDLETGAGIHRLQGHKSKVTGLDLASSNHAVSASSDGSLRIWDLLAGECLHILQHQEGEVRFAVHGTRIISGPVKSHRGERCVMKVWDINSGNCVAELLGKHSGINRIIPLQQNRVALINGDNSFQVWDLSSHQCLVDIEGHYLDDTIYEVLSDRHVVSHIGKSVTGRSIHTTDFSVRIWDLTTGQCQHVIHCTSRPQQIKTALGGQAFCICCKDFIEVRDTNTGEHRFSIQTPVNQSNVELLAVTADGSKAICTGTPDTLVVWDLLHNQHFRTLRGTGVKPPIAMTSDDLFLSASTDHSLHVWDLNSGAHLRVMRGHDAPIKQLAMAGLGMAVSISEDRTVRLWDVETSRLRKWPEAPRAHGSSPQLLPHNRGLTVSGKTISIWNLETGSLVHTLEGHTSTVIAVEATAGGQLISASADDTLRIWNLITGQCELTLSDPSGISHMALASDQHAVTTSAKGFVRVWDLAGGEFIDTPDRHQGPISQLKLLRFKRALSLGHDGDVRIWDLASGQCIQQFNANPELVLAPDPIVLEPDRVLIVGKDYTMVIWHMLTGERLHTLTGHKDRIMDLVLTPDERVVSVSLDKSVRVWDLRTERCVHVFRTEETSNPPHRIKLTAPTRIAVQCMGGQSLAWDIDRGDFLGDANAATFTNVTNKNHADPGPKPFPVWESSESGFTWQLDGKDDEPAFYPLNGQAAVGCDLQHERILLTEQGSNEIHILHVNRGRQRQAEQATLDHQVAEEPKPLRLAEWVAGLKIESLFGPSNVAPPRNRKIGFIAGLSLFAGLIGFATWTVLENIGPLIITAIIILGLLRFMKRNIYDLCSEASRRRAVGDLEGALMLLNHAEKKYKKRLNSQPRAVILFEQAGVLEELGHWEAALNCLVQAEPIMEGMREKLFYKRCLLGQWQILEKNNLDPQKRAAVLSRLAKRLLEEGDRESAMHFAAQGQRAAAATESFEQIFKAILLLPKELQTSPEFLKEFKNGTTRPIPGPDLVQEIMTNRTVAAVAERIVSDNHADPTLVLRWKADSLLTVKDYSQALEVYAKLEQVARESHDETNELAGIANQAFLLAELGRISEGLEMAERAEAFARRVQDKSLLATVLERHLEMLMERQGSLTPTAALMDELHQIALELGDTDVLLRALNIQARVHEFRKDYTAATETLRIMEASLRELGQDEELLVCLGRLAVSMVEVQHTKRSLEEVYTEIESLARAFNRNDYLGFTLVNHALLKEKEYGLYAEALSDLREARDVFRRVGDSENLSKVDQNIRAVRASAVKFMNKTFDEPAEKFLERGDSAAALRLIDEQLLFCRQSKDPEFLAKALAAKALVITDGLSEPAQAIPYWDEAYRVARSDDLEGLADQINQLRKSISEAANGG
jgi:WD40 repeat protein/tetratricopeptide (TPR) repeat protein